MARGIKQRAPRLPPGKALMASVRYAARWRYADGGIFAFISSKYWLLNAIDNRRDACPVSPDWYEATIASSANYTKKTAFNLAPVAASADAALLPPAD